MKHKVLSLTAIAGAMLYLAPAHANTIDITLSESGFTTTQVGTGDGSATFTGAYGTFTINAITALGIPVESPNDLLNSNTQNVSSKSGGILTVTVTEFGLSTGSQGLLSTFTSNQLFNASVTEQTFLDTTNTGLLTTSLGSHSFTGPDTATVGSAGTSGTYSLSEVFTITAGALGSDNSTIDVSATPLPAALPLFAGGLLGMWGWRRRRKAA